MDRYKVSYQQIYSWVQKYKKSGVDGLVDMRGKAKPENKLTETDRLKAKIKMLEAENHRSGSRFELQTYSNRHKRRSDHKDIHNPETIPQNP